MYTYQNRCVGLEMYMIRNMIPVTVTKIPRVTIKSTKLLRALIVLEECSPYAQARKECGNHLSFRFLDRARVKFT